MAEEKVKLFAEYDSDNPFGGQGLSQVLKVFNPRTEYLKSYPFQKRFVKSSRYKSNKTASLVTDIDDPTYLGFNIRFDKKSPLFNGYSEDSKIPNNSESGTPQDKRQYSSIESAIGYLNKRGEQNRAKHLNAFVEGLFNINYNRPYYWQTIDGLTEAWNKMIKVENSYSGSSDDEGIVIGCLEAIDLKITGLFSFYKNAVYDTKYRRKIIPNNLLYFDVYVDVLEIRNFKTLLDSLNSDNDDIDIDNLNNKGSVITLKFEDCKWMPEESGQFLGQVTNAGGNEFINTSMKFNYSKCTQQSQFFGYDSFVDESKNQTTQREQVGDEKFPSNFKEAKKRIAKEGKILLEDVKEDAKKSSKRFGNRVKNIAIDRVRLGNIYGIRNRVINRIENPEYLRNTLIGADLAIRDAVSNRRLREYSVDNIYSNEAPGPLDDEFNSVNIYD